MATRTKAHDIGLWSSGAALCAIASLLLVGCSTAAPGEDSGPAGAVEQPAQQEVDAHAGLTAEAIVAAVEPEGLECAEEDPLLETRAQLIVCKGDDYVIITATRLVDAGLVAEQIADAKKSVCDSGLKIDGTRFATSGAWILAPGGGDDKNIAAFDAAMNSLGLEWSEDLC